MPSSNPGSGLNHTFRTEDSRRFAECWFSLPRQGLLPQRTAFDPALIPDLLPMIMLRDVEPDGSSRYRLAGTGIVELFGVELTGRQSHTIMPEKENDRIRKLTRLMFEHPCGFCGVLKLTTASGRSLQVENVSFPFAPTPGGRRQALGFLSPLAEGFDSRLREAGIVISATDNFDFVDVGAGVPDFPDMN